MISDELIDPMKDLLTHMLFDDIHGIDNPYAIATVGAPGSGKTCFVNDLSSDTQHNIVTAVNILNDVTNNHLPLDHHKSTVVETHPFDNTAYISPAMIKDVLLNNVDIQNYLNIHDRDHPLQEIYSDVNSERAQNFTDTINDIWTDMVSHAVNGKYNFVLDTCFNVTAPGVDSSDVDSALNALNTQSYNVTFVGIKADVYEAVDREGRDFENGKKPYFDPDKIENQVNNFNNNINYITDEAKNYDNFHIVVINTNYDVLSRV